MVALSVAAIVACACVVFLEPRLAGGARTPEIPISIMVSKLCRQLYKDGVFLLQKKLKPPGSSDRDTFGKVTGMVRSC